MPVDDQPPAAGSRKATNRRAARAGRTGAGPDYYVLVALTATLLGLGLVMVLSASSVTAYVDFGNSYIYFRREVLWVAVGVIAMIVISRIDYHRWRRLGLPLLVGATLALVYVQLRPSSVAVYGSTRWIALPAGLSVQPSELAKLALLLFGADVLARKEAVLGDVRHLLYPLLPATLVVAGLVLLQPDLGTTLLLCAISFSLLFLAEGSLLALGGVGLLGVVAGLAAILHDPYRRERLLSFLHPTADLQTANYQVLQARLALGSGGLLGVGLGASRQKWMYVPNAFTDFIYAIIGEELGLVGTFLVVGLFAGIAVFGFRVARRAPDPLGRYLAGGVTVWIVAQAVVNMGAVVGVFPVTGVPLPLVSFGGSSTIVLLAAAGVLLNVARQEAGWARRPQLRAVTTGTPPAPRRTRDRRPAAPARAGGGRTAGGARRRP